LVSLSLNARTFILSNDSKAPFCSADNFDLSTFSILGETSNAIFIFRVFYKVLLQRRFLQPASNRLKKL
jgi:hypothetical protein